MALDKCCVNVKMVCGLGRIFRLAFKQPNKTALTGHMFASKQYQNCKPYKKFKVPFFKKQTRSSF